MSVRIGHAHLKVRDLERAVEFYRRYLGLEVRERLGRFAFMSGGAMHHELALQSVGAAAPAPPPAATGLYHVAFEVPDKRSLAARFKALIDAGVPVVAVDHRISWAIYFSDPDGNGLELYCDTRAEADSARSWDGRDRRLGAEQILSELAG